MSQKEPIKLQPTGDLYILKGVKDTEHGPINSTELRSWISKYICTSNTLVKVNGSDNWVKLGTLADFAAELGQQQLELGQRQPHAYKGDGRPYPLWFKVILAFVVGLFGYMVWFALDTADVFPDEGVKWMFLFLAGGWIIFLIGTFKGWWWCDTSE